MCKTHCYEGLALHVIALLNTFFVVGKPYRSNILDPNSLIVSDHIISTIHLHCV